ncbi:hypothetical protein NKH54_00685 [Mesorhizobium sp. M1004]|uniref:hypothetical protein n=1 Tax=Mesorhizobium sp. M1004 TaxID=2957046 RepID=UPI00333C2A91
MPNKEKSERLPWSVEQALLVHTSINLAARDAVIGILCELPDKTWLAMKPVLERWIAIGNANRADLRRIIDEVDYRRREFPRGLTLSNDNKGRCHDRD